MAASIVWPWLVSAFLIPNILRDCARRLVPRLDSPFPTCRRLLVSQVGDDLALPTSGGRARVASRSNSPVVLLFCHVPAHARSS
ncbi:hypothetical protein BC567DRAFT_238064 [Phyllosticta citribraziliensis]